MDSFVDYYELLQLSSSAEPTTIQRVYRMLVARYHPDNRETGDIEKFQMLQEAFAVLSDPEKRANYDTHWTTKRVEPMPVFELKDFVVGIDAEFNRRLGILCLLYNKRRADPAEPGISMLELEGRMSLPREHLEFTVWYLRDKEFVRRDEDTSEISITGAGVDYVESNLPSNKIARKLLNAPEKDRVWMVGEDGVAAGQKNEP